MDGETYLTLITATFYLVVFLALFGDKVESLANFLADRLCDFLDWSFGKLAEWLSSRSRR